MNFLDIKMKAKGGNIITDIFYKDTDTLNYVPFKSAHPKHTLLNIPYNLARRPCKMVDKRMTLEERLSKLEQVLKQLGYPQHIIKNGIEKAKRIPQETLRRPKERVHNNKVLTFISTHNLRNPNLYTLIKQSIPMLNASPKMKKPLEYTRIIPSKRQPPILKKILRRARFTTDPRAEDQQNKVRKCLDLKCEVCKELQVGSHVKLGKGNKKTPFNIKARMDCSVRDFIYMINCSGCKEQYIGESRDTLQPRASIHRTKFCTQDIENCT